ncbi:MAG: class I SAM-dependent methyltransferase [Opitutales bacterium]|nr:class I SAM-dependent methyltransferase [Opitutales bacterium]
METIDDSPTSIPFTVQQCRWDGYALLDSGGGRKLEQFGESILVRPETKAWWQPARPELWPRADAEFRNNGVWRLRNREQARSWSIPLKQLTLEARLTDMSKHVGVFPEQEPHWRWMVPRLQAMKNPRVLNLFGYTGVASLVAASAGAQVTHVDASKPSIAWGRQHQSLSRMDDAPIRWLLDDAFKFVAREVRRGHQYQAILLDPPSFGRGPKGEVWKVEQQIVQLLDQLKQLIAPGSAMVIMTLYNLEASAFMLANLLGDAFQPGRLECGELTLRETHAGRILPLSLFARWSRDI